jgi:bacillithiol biosynthesis cysteine-adding enzyme BshC
MNPACLKHTCIPGTSQLFLDYLYHFDRVSRFYDSDPFRPESFREAAETIEYPAERRKSIVRALAAQNPESRSVEVLADRGTVAVVTGQQVGLFSGPAYTVYKAVTAARLARRLSDEGLPAVPVFWLATEDHDLAEVNHAWVFNRELSPQRLECEVDWAGGPAGEAVLKRVPLDELTGALDGFAFKGEVLDLVRQCYRPGAKLGEAFKALLEKLLCELDLIFLDPLDPALRQIAAPFLADAVSRTSELVAGIRARDEELQRAGYHAQVHVEADTSPFFLLDRERRISVKVANGRFVNRQGSYSTEELESQADRLSPNALLRPVMQDYLLPTVAYVGGPAEVAYMAQAEVAYRKLLGRMPVIVPRNGFTLFDHRAAKLMERFRLQVPELLAHEELARERIAERLVPPGIQESIGTTRAAIDRELERLNADLQAFDPTLAAALEKSNAKIRYQLEKLSRKVTRERLRRDRQAAEDAEYLIHSIYPERHLQERFYTILPFLAQHGLDLVGRLFEASRLDCPDHMLRDVEDLPALVYSN